MQKFTTLHCFTATEAIKAKRPGMLTRGVRLLQDNALVHNSSITQMEARSCGPYILPHPPHFPDLVLSDFSPLYVNGVILERQLFSR